MAVGNAAGVWRTRQRRNRSRAVGARGRRPHQRSPTEDVACRFVDRWAAGQGGARRARAAGGDGTWCGRPSNGVTAQVHDQAIGPQHARLFGWLLGMHFCCSRPRPTASLQVWRKRLALAMEGRAKIAEAMNKAWQKLFPGTEKLPEAAETHRRRSLRTAF